MLDCEDRRRGPKPGAAVKLRVDGPGSPPEPGIERFVQYETREPRASVSIILRIGGKCRVRGWVGPRPGGELPCREMILWTAAFRFGIFPLHAPAPGGCVPQGRGRQFPRCHPSCGSDAATGKVALRCIGRSSHCTTQVAAPGLTPRSALRRPLGAARFRAATRDSDIGSTQHLKSQSQGMLHAAATAAPRTW